MTVINSGTAKIEFKPDERIQVHVTTPVNNSRIRGEKRNGREVIIIPSATLPDDIVMNGITYPADEIEKSFNTLERAPAPLGHPTINNEFVSASDPEGINRGWIGAWNENVRRENGRVFLDKVVDIEVANRTASGKELLKAIEDGSPIHTSTGLYCNIEATVNDKGDEVFNARNIHFDHDAILLNEEGAATPEQGVGIFVNSKGEGEKMRVINSALDRIEDRIDWAGMDLLSALEDQAKATLWERVKSAIMETLSPAERETSANHERNAEMADEKQLGDLSTKLDGIADSLSGLGDTLANSITKALEPVTTTITEMQNAQKAKDEAELMAAVNKVVKANLLSEEVAKTMPLAALNELSKNIVEGKAKNLVKGIGNGSDEDGDEWKDVNLNKNIDDAMKEAQH